MNKKRLLYFILALIIIPSVILLVRSAINGKASDLQNAAGSSEIEAPATLEEVVEEFSEEGETVDPDTLSEYVEDYEIEIQEDDVVNIN